MAAWFDLTKRLEAGLYQDERLEVGGIYRPAPLPGWLLTPWLQAQREANGKAPVLAVNCKGDKPGDVVCLVRLADLERLLGQNDSLTAALQRLFGPVTAELVADPETRDAALLDLLATAQPETVLPIAFVPNEVKPDSDEGRALLALLRQAQGGGLTPQDVDNC